MKKITYKILAVATAVILITGSESCNKLEKFQEGINVDPNTTPNPITSALLTNVEANLSQLAVDVNNRAGLYCQYFSETQYTDASLYSTPEFNYISAVYAGTTTNTYSGILFDCQNIINQNTNNPAVVVASGSNKNQIAIAKILKSYIFSTLTDKWGDVPYSEALQGGANIYPKYDTQEDIYKGMLKDLKDAVTGFDAGPAIAGDLIYGGNTAKWKKLGNSLRLILAVRMSKVYPAAGAFAATEAAAALADAGGIIATNADNFTIVYPGGSYHSPWYNLYDGRNDYAISKTMTDILTTMADGRRTKFSPNNVGFPYGLTRDLAITVPASDNKILALSYRDDVNDDVVIVSAATVLLAKTEAQERGWISGQGTAEAELSYNAAIDQSYAQWGLGSAAAYYGAGAAANYSTGTGSAAAGQNSFGSIVAGQNATTASKLERIALQLYLGNYPNGTKGWSDWRRTGFPKLSGTTFAINAGKQICRRFVYGQSETGLNPANLAIAIARLSGGNTADARVWWDKP